MSAVWQVNSLPCIKSWISSPQSPFLSLRVMLIMAGLVLSVSEQECVWSGRWLSHWCPLPPEWPCMHWPLLLGRDQRFRTHRLASSITKEVARNGAEVLTPWSKPWWWEAGFTFIIHPRALTPGGKFLQRERDPLCIVRLLLHRCLCRHIVMVMCLFQMKSDLFFFVTEWILWAKFHIALLLILPLAQKMKHFTPKLHPAETAQITSAREKQGSWIHCSHLDSIFELMLLWSRDEELRMNPPVAQLPVQCDGFLPTLALIAQCPFCIQVFTNQICNSQPVPEVAHSMPFKVLLNYFDSGFLIICKHMGEQNRFYFPLRTFPSSVSFWKLVAAQMEIFVGGTWW